MARLLGKAISWSSKLQVLIIDVVADVFVSQLFREVTRKPFADAEAIHPADIGRRRGRNPPIIITPPVEP
jgi:hypothetical protein